MNTGTGVPEWPRMTLEHFAKELTTRIELLQLLVVGIVAVLGDQQNAVDGKLAGSEGQGIGNRGAQPDVMPFGVRRRDRSRAKLDRCTDWRFQTAACAAHVRRERQTRRGIGRRCDRRATGSNRRSPAPRPWALQCLASLGERLIHAGIARRRQPRRTTREIDAVLNSLSSLVAPDLRTGRCSRLDRARKC